MKTRSRGVNSVKGRVDYKKLTEDPVADELENPRPTSKARHDPPSPSAPAAAPLLPPTPEMPQVNSEQPVTSAPDEQVADKSAVGTVTDTSKIIDEFLKALRPDPEEPARQNPAPRPGPIAPVDGSPPAVLSPTLPNHSYDTMPPPRSSLNAGSQKETKFPCTFARYGCTSSFGSKNEWKRHVAIQHVQLGFYRCDVGVCNPENRDTHSRDSGYNDFNRKDLFTMHQRRMHSPWGVTRQPTPEEKESFEGGLDGVRQRCWRAKRQPPLRTTCGFCSRVFEDKIPTMPGPPPPAAITAAAGLASLAQDHGQSIMQDSPSLPHLPISQIAKLEERGDAMDMDRKVNESGDISMQTSPTSPTYPQGQGQMLSPIQTTAQPQSGYPPLNTPQTPTATDSGLSMGSYPPLPSPGTASSYPPLPSYGQSPESTPRTLAPGPAPPRQLQFDAHGQPIVREPTAWEDRMEHVGRHLAKEDAYLREEAEDPDLTAWGLREGMLRDCGAKGVWLIGHEPQGDSLEGIIRKRKKRIK